MNRRLFGIIWLAFLILVLSSHYAFTESSEVSIDNIISPKESYDDKEVSVSGTLVQHKNLTAEPQRAQRNPFLLGGAMHHVGYMTKSPEPHVVQGEAAPQSRLSSRIIIFTSP